MKALKTIITAFLLLQTAVSFGQTKEETIEWLKEKLGTYMYNPHPDSKGISLVSIDECKIVFNYHTGETNWQQTLPTSINKINDVGRFVYDALVATDQNQSEGKNPKFYKESYLKLNQREENIYARVEKALKHLATFCPKKKEAF